MLPDTDEGLIELVQKGRQDAFSQLVLRHEGAVYSLCYRMTMNVTEAEDLAQESFLRFYRSIDRFQPGARLRPWLRKIVVNVCLDALRRRKAPPLPLEELVAGGMHPQVHSRDELPEAAYLSREAKLDVQAALLRLPVEYRMALVLRYLEELSYQEIADALGIPVSTIETRLFRAKKMLGPILASPMGTGKGGYRP
jgi:RNA polymerase sigma-70 factor, ECF subfamily